MQLSPDQILENARKLVPRIAARADEIAALRRLPADLVAELKSAGLFRMPMPAAWGGPEMSPRAQVEAVEIVSTADPSVGWCVMIGSDSGFYGARLEESAARALFPDLDAVTAGLLFPVGRAERVPGGYRVSGRWAFGSGCTHADVIAGGCIVFEGEQPVLGESGLPEARVLLAPASSWQILDTWYTTGLAGSGSNDYTLKDQFVPAAHSFGLLEPAWRPEPLYAWNMMFLANAPGVPLGLARRAIDSLREIVEGKRLMPDNVLYKDLPRVRTALARAEMWLGAARAYVYDSLDLLWEQLRARGELSREIRIHVALARVNAFQVARAVADLMVDTAGTTAIFASSPLDRLVRDAITLSQHIVAQERILEQAGALAVGVEPALPLV